MKSLKEELEFELTTLKARRAEVESLLQQAQRTGQSAANEIMSLGGAIRQTEILLNKLVIEPEKKKAERTALSEKKKKAKKSSKD